MRLCQQPESWMKYALLLSQTNQQAEAIRIYQKALLVVPDITERTITRFPDATTLAPREFQASVHIALGLCASFGVGSDKAMAEFAKARQLEPASSLTNYYYGYGWQRLAPAVRAKYGTPQQAKAALQKAVKLGKGDVKLAAAKALKSFS